ncbi:hypothetical protein GGX14DRAFT_648064 [Mycena pura]|uniref:F-box domain-containing protein n=1 Tax=Mycena pura TaxID=153505 RepID=A0AAD6Y7N7_9AGAR|nr:hypothetical protein GGX14DRAFT_648064 [Mycena pura]
MITAAAAALRAQLDGNDKSMAALETQMTALRAQREQLLKDLGSITEYHWLQSYHCLLKLASVCQTWRAVTLSTCALWNEIVILYCGGGGDVGELLKVCLPRAGSLPLDLDICLPADDSDYTIISTLSLYGSQWRRVCLTSGRSSIFRHFPSSLPLLESFTLSDFKVNHASVSSLRHAPQLRELCLCHSSWAIQLGLPFNELTKLTLKEFKMAELLVVLPHALNLECLELSRQWASIKDTRETPTQAPLPILLPRLHTFMCRGAAMVFHYLMLPALERLQLEDYVSDAGARAILSCVARSCSTIRTLDISRLAFDSGYHRLRTSLPTIRHLCLAWPGMLRRDDKQNSFFAAMKSGSCLPNLESLTWDRCSPYGAEQLFTVISAAISARWWGVEGTTKLSTVSLHFEEGRVWDIDTDTVHEYEDALDQLYELGRQGLKLEVTGYWSAKLYITHVPRSFRARATKYLALRKPHTYGPSTSSLDYRTGATASAIVTFSA